MVRNKQTIGFIILFLVISMCLCGCSSGKDKAQIGKYEEETESFGTKDPVRYKATEQELNIDDPLGANRYSLTDGDVLCSSFSNIDFISEIFKSDPESKENTTVFSYDSAENEYIGIISISENDKGNINAIGSRFDNVGGDEYYLLGFNPEGKVIEQIKLQKDDGSMMGVACIEASDRIICGGLYDKKGYISEISRDRGMFTELKGIPNEYILGVGPARKENGFLFYTDTSVYYYDLAGEESERVFDWQDVDIDGTKITAVEKYDGKYFALFSDHTSDNPLYYVISEDNEPDPIKEPTEIVIGTLWKYGLENIVAKYNRSQDNYRVRIEEYRTDDTYIGTEDDVNRMMADLLGNDPYDIMDLDCFEYNTPDIEDLLRQDYITDLTPFIDESEKVSTKDYYDTVVDICRVGDSLAGIPISFEIMTCYADADIFEQDSTTVKDIIDYDRAHDDKILFKEADRYFVLNELLLNNIDYFVDEETGKCNFDSEEFKDIVEYAAEFPEESETNYYYRQTSDEDIIKKISFQTIDGFRMVSQFYFGGNAVVIGMPGCEEGFRTSLKLYGKTLAITENSKNKEGAWDFIEFFLSQKPSIKEYGIPSKKEYLDEYLDELSEDKDGISQFIRIMNADGTVCGEFEIHPLTVKDRELFIKMVTSAEKYKGFGTDTVGRIVSEELDPFFYGQKTLDDCIKIIQSRVSLYLAERN